MDVFRCLLLLFLHQATCASDGAEETGAVGRSVTFHLQNPDGRVAAWSFGNNLIVTVEFGKPSNPTFFDNKFRERLTFSEDGKALTISGLRLEDAGIYTAKISEAEASFTFTLHVYRELLVPMVMCVARNCSANNCSYTLRCAVSGSGFGNVSYSWSKGGSPWSREPELLVEEQSPHETLLTCTVKNPVSTRNVTVTSPAALCTENTTHPPSTGPYSGWRAGIVASVVTLVVMLLAVVILVMYCRSKGWKTFHLPTAEVTNPEAGAECSTVYAQVGPSQQLNMQNFSNVQRNDPKKTLTSDEDTSKTIYFTIQATGQTDDEKMGNSAGCQEWDEKTVYASVNQPDPAARP